jgi:recombination protein RecA
MASTDPNKEIKEVVANIEKQVGEGAIMWLRDAAAQPIEGIPTGSLSLDIALGGKGLPRGRIIEIFGAEASGKTTLALHALANAQKKGGVAAFIDAEHALDPSWAKRIGVDLESLLVSQPSFAEEALKIAEMLVHSNAVDIIVIDSVAALVPKAEIDGEISEQQVGLQARLMSKVLRMLNPTIAKTKTCMIFINQIRQKIGMTAGYGDPNTTPGGLALKFYSSVRLQVKRHEQIKGAAGTTEPIGSRTQVKVVKNKVAPPFRVAEFDLLHDSGISREGDLIDLGEEAKIISKRGSYFSYGDMSLGQGRENVRQFLRDNVALAQEIERKILEARGLLSMAEAVPVEENGASETPVPPVKEGRSRRSQAAASTTE